MAVSIQRALVAGNWDGHPLYKMESQWEPVVGAEPDTYKILDPRVWLEKYGEPMNHRGVVPPPTGHVYVVFRDELQDDNHGDVYDERVAFSFLPSFLDSPEYADFLFAIHTGSTWYKVPRVMFALVSDYPIV